MHVNNLMLALEKRKMRPLHDPILWLFTLLLVAVVAALAAVAIDFSRAKIASDDVLGMCFAECTLYTPHSVHSSAMV